MSERRASNPHPNQRDDRGSSPYATGGGGYTFERRVAVTYLARLLTGETAGELQGRRVQRVSFQQAPAHKVDDLVVTAAEDDGCGRIELEIAVRRAPKFTASDDDSKKLIGSLLASVCTTPKEEVGERLAICVAGPQPAAGQVNNLAGLAKQQATASGFHSLVRTPGKFDRSLRSRLDHLVKLVAANMPTAGVDASPEAAEAETWKLLRGLQVLMPRLEAPDETDWNDLANRLLEWAYEPSVPAATALRDRLESLAASYAPAAADVDLAALRRDAHEQIHLERRRREVAWKELRRLDAEAKGAVRTTLGVGPSPEPLHLRRVGPASQVRKALSSVGGVLVTGDSGTGKSALILKELADAATSEPLSLDVVCLDLRQLPTTMTELRNALGAPLEDLLAEMSTPTRLLVLDEADLTIERDDQLLAPLLRAAQNADVTPWIICATEARNAVRAVAEEIEGSFSELVVGGLDDSELEAVSETFPQLRRLLDEPRAKELLRRPGVIDFFVRSGNRELPLSDADAFRTVWSKIVRRDSRRDRGSPHARDEVLRQLARQQLLGSAEAVSLDSAAVTGLQRDALLRPADPWKLLPVFAHDLVRTYSVARVLLSKEDLAQELIAIGAPRWALPATRIAVQVLLSEKESPEKPRAGRLVRLQAAMDRLPEAGHGDRWSDLPTEAVLTLPESGKILGDAWPSLVESRSAGLRRVLRVIQQRHSPAGITDSLVAEPLVELLLEHGWPLQLTDMVNTVMRGWLRGLVRASKDAGHRLRIALRERLVARVAEGNKRLVEIGHEQEARLAARTQEEVAEAEERIRARSHLVPLDPESRRPHGEWRELPPELTDKELLEQLALLGADLGDGGEALLRRVAAGAPRRLLPALERTLTGHGIATYDLHLLIYLTDSYYIEEIDDYAGTHRNGIREHMYRGSAAPQSAAYLGPFQAMLRADPLVGVTCLNRLLNHAAQVRVQSLRDLRRDYSPELAEQYAVELDITGERRCFMGDEHVWMWYRGTGVGPYPCMSALQALELLCDDGVRAGVPLERLVHLLLQDCKNLAMPGLIVGMLVRHLEKVESELDPFLATPEVWRFEFARTINESLSCAAQTEGVAAPDRRKWNLRDVATRLALSAAGDRIESLRVVGQQLVERATELEGPASREDQPSERLAAVRNWAGSLDRGSYRATKTNDGVLFEQVADKEIIARLAASNADLSRSHEATRLMLRYPERYNHLIERTSLECDELLDDLGTARGFANNPPSAVPGSPLDAPAAVAAAALEARFLDGMDVPLEDMVWAAALLVGLGITSADRGAHGIEYAVLGFGADRAVARVLPLLTLPAASDLRSRLETEDIDTEAINKAVTWIVDCGSNESRLFLARGFDSIWYSPCEVTKGRCLHAVALSVLEDIARDCLSEPKGTVRHESNRHQVDGPVAPGLEETENEHLDVSRLNAVIRGTAAAAISPACCRKDAAVLLAASLAAHRRGLLNGHADYQSDSNNSAFAARALLDVAATGDRTLLFAHMNGYSRDPRFLSMFLRTLAAAGEESPTRASAAKRLWPIVLTHVVKLVEDSRFPTDDSYYQQAVIAATIPEPAYGSVLLHREFDAEPIRWVDPVELSPQIEQWLPVAAGLEQPLDALLCLLDPLPVEQQAQLGLPWIEQLVEADPNRLANRSTLLPRWLERVRSNAGSGALRAAWHRVVDALIVAGDSRTAELAD